MEINPSEKYIIGFDAKRANANRTGLGNYSRSVIDALASRCPQSEFRLYLPRHHGNDAFDTLLGYPNVKEVLPAGWIWSRAKSLWRVFGISKKLRKDGVKLFHGLSNELPTGLRRNGIKSIVTIHDLIFLRYPAFYAAVDRHIYEMKFRHACRKADRIIAASECTKRDIVHYFGTAPEKIEVIYQGCSSQFGKPATEEAKRDVQARYGLPEHFMFNVGTIEERKNLLTAVKALAHLPETIHLVAVGRHTKYADKVLDYAKAHGLENRVHILYYVPFADLQALYALAGYFVYPSLYEGFGIPIIEAISAGLPVIAATGSCLEETGGPDSLYISGFDDKALAEAVIRVDADAELRKRMIENSREYIRRFDMEGIAEQLFGLYKRVLDE